MCLWTAVTEQLEPIQHNNIEDHIFELYSERQLQNNLGYVDRTANEITVTLPKNKIDLNITQSLTQLANQKSNASSTGFICWQSSIFFIDWLISPECPFQLSKTFTILELGSGSAGICASVLLSKVQHFIATDQKHVLKLLRQNIENNVSNFTSQSSFKTSGGNPHKLIDVVEFDWENIEMGKFNIQSLNMQKEHPDIIIACDTIYNEYLIPHFVQSLNALMAGNQQTVALVAIQLRDLITFEVFVTEVVQSGKLLLYNVPDHFLSDDLKNGYVVYCILKN